MEARPTRVGDRFAAMRARTGRRTAWAGIGAAGVLGILGVLGVLGVLGGAPARAHDASTPPSGVTARSALDTLSVKGRAPLTGYSREAFGTPWSDVDGNGCDTRNDILRRDLIRTRTVDCVVLTGLLSPDPYTDRVIAHVAGRSAIDIDHVVSLSDAWQKGAFRWTDRQRLLFANDPLNLLAVDASANRQKSDSDAASWLPPHKAYRCSFVARQVAVKVRYALWVTAAERDAIARILASCPQQGLPTAAPARSTD